MGKLIKVTAVLVISLIIVIVSGYLEPRFTFSSIEAERSSEIGENSNDGISADVNDESNNNNDNELNNDCNPAEDNIKEPGRKAEQKEQNNHNNGNDSSLPGNSLDSKERGSRIEVSTGEQQLSVYYNGNLHKTFTVYWS